ncbi:amino acid ABC transporter permease, partial [Escherichia coli]
MAIVAVSDLMYVGKSLATEAYRPLETYTLGSLQQSALVAIVAVSDLMYVGKSLATEAYRPL